MKPVTNTEIGYRVFDVIYHHTGAGPFDGGCVVYAEALKAVFGGVIVSLIKSNDAADHAAVLINDTVYDYEGGLPKDQFIDRFNRHEMAQVIGIRAFRESDLCEAPRNDKAVDELVVIFKQWHGSLTLPYSVN